MTLLEIIELLNQQQRDYNSVFVRRVCEFIVGRRFSDKTWQRWRVRADVVQWRHELKWGECLVLCTIAFLKRNNFDRPISDDEIVQILSQSKATGFFSSCLDEEIEIGLPAKRLADVIAKHHPQQWKPSRSTLYRRLEGFSMKDRYYAEDVDRALAQLAG